MKPARNSLLFWLMFVFYPERTMNPGLDAPVIALVSSRNRFFGFFKAVFWVVSAIVFGFLISTLH